MDGEELRLLPHGSVVATPESTTYSYWRKGRRDTWHPISQVNGQRIGQRNTYHSHYLVKFFGPVTNADAESERLRQIKETP